MVKLRKGWGGMYLRTYLQKRPADPFQTKSFYMLENAKKPALLFFSRALRGYVLVLTHWPGPDTTVLPRLIIGLLVFCAPLYPGVPTTSRLCLLLKGEDPSYLCASSVRGVRHDRLLCVGDENYFK